MECHLILDASTVFWVGFLDALASLPEPFVTHVTQCTDSCFLKPPNLSSLWTGSQSIWSIHPFICPKCHDIVEMWFSEALSHWCYGMPRQASEESRSSKLRFHRSLKPLSQIFIKCLNHESDLSYSASLSWFWGLFVSRKLMSCEIQTILLMSCFLPPCLNVSPAEMRNVTIWRERQYCRDGYCMFYGGIDSTALETS